MERFSISKRIYVFFGLLQKIKDRVCGGSVQPFLLRYVLLLWEEDDNTNATRPADRERCVQEQPLLVDCPGGFYRLHSDFHSLLLASPDCSTKVDGIIAPQESPCLGDL